MPANAPPLLQREDRPFAALQPLGKPEILASIGPDNGFGLGLEQAGE